MKYATDFTISKMKGITIEDIRADYTEEEKKKILSYLKCYRAIAFTSQPVFDIFTGKQVGAADNGRSDGEYMWYESEIYHFEHYDMRLQKDFIEHVLKRIAAAE